MNFYDYFTAIGIFVLCVLCVVCAGVLFAVAVALAAAPWALMAWIAYMCFRALGWIT